MLTEQQVRETLRQRSRILVPVILSSAMALCAYLVLIGGFLHSGWGFLLIFPAFAVFLIPLAIVDRYASRFTSLCPACSVDVTMKTRQMIATRCCPDCGERIVAGGRVRDIAVYKRFCQLRTVSFLKYWLWAWPVLTSLALVWHWFDPGALQNCRHLLFVPSLVGFSAAGWAWLRTTSPWYIPQCLASLSLLVIGGFAYWQAL